MMPPMMRLRGGKSSRCKTRMAASMATRGMVCKGCMETKGSSMVGGTAPKGWKLGEAMGGKVATKSSLRCKVVPPPLPLSRDRCKARSSGPKDRGTSSSSSSKVARQATLRRVKSSMAMGGSRGGVKTKVVVMARLGRGSSTRVTSSSRCMIRVVGCRVGGRGSKGGRGSRVGMGMCRGSRGRSMGGRMVGIIRGGEGRSRGGTFRVGNRVATSSSGLVDGCGCDEGDWLCIFVALFGGWFGFFTFYLGLKMEAGELNACRWMITSAY